MSLASLKVPAILAAGVIGFGLGAAAGCAALAGFGYRWTPPPPSTDRPAMMPMTGGPVARGQFVSLVAKLDQLTDKPLAVRLSEEQREQLRRLLRGLDEEQTLTEEDARKRLDAALETIKDQRATLEAAGYRWPGRQGGFRAPAESPNPFKEGPDAEHLKSLQERLEKAKPG